MGLLDNFIDPEMMAQLKAFNQPSDEDKAAARNNALMNAGFAMLMNNRGGNSRQAFGNALGAGGMAGMGAYQSSLEEAQKNNMQPLQMAMAMKKLTKENLPSGMQIGPDGKLMWIPGYLEGQQQMHQSSQQPYWTTVSTPQGLFKFNARTGETMPMQGTDSQPLVKDTASPFLQGEIAGAKEGAKVRAESQANAEIQLPSYIGQANETLKQIQELRDHPGFGTAVGKSSMLQVQRIPGTDAYSFMNRLGQLKGGAFLQAFNNLKGGGQITEIEGKKATDAIARMDNATSEDEFKSALNDYESVIKAGVDRASQKAKGPDQVRYPSDAGKPGVRVPDGKESRAAILSAEMQSEQAKLAEARKNGDLKGISEANRNIQLLQKELGSSAKQPTIQPDQVPKVRRYNAATGRIE
jgi:hypothetical protein